MSLGLNATIRNNRLNTIKTAVDAGGAAGFLRVYDGTRPATGGAATNLLAQLTFSYPCAPTASGGSLTFSAITAGTAGNSGTATWCRIVDSTGAFVSDGSAGTSGADYNLSTTAISSGVQVSCVSAVLTEGNP